MARELFFLSNFLPGNLLFAFLVYPKNSFFTFFQMVNEKNAIEMIKLVLKNNRWQTL